MIGQRLGAFVRPGQVPEVWAGVAGLFRDYGYRRLRHRARIKFLVADWGPEKFREVLEKEYLGLRAARRPAAGGAARRRARPRGRAPAAGRAQLRGLRADGGPASRPTRSTSSPTWPPGTAAAGCAPPPSRRWSSSTCRRSAPTTWSPSSTRPGCPPDPSAFRRNTMACTGIEFCKLAIVETKARAADLISRARAAAARLRRAGHDQRQRLPELLRPDPDGRHRAEGIAGHRPGRDPGRGLPDPPGRQPGRRRRRGLRLRPQAARAQDHRRGTARLRGAGPAPVPGGRAAWRELRRLDGASQRGGPHVSTRAVSRSTAPTAARKTSNRRARPTANGIAAVAPGVSSYALPE